jgi:hypothetical protein
MLAADDRKFVVGAVRRNAGSASRREKVEEPQRRRRNAGTLANRIGR